MKDKIYYVCKYTPLEILKGYGLEAVRLEPELDAAECCTAAVHPNLCGYGKAVLQEIFRGNIKNLFLVDCCDVCRKIYDILQAKKNMDFLFLMYLPHKKSPREAEQLTGELHRLNDFLMNYTNKTFDEKTAGDVWRFEIEKSIANKIEEEHIILTGAHGGSGLKEKIEKITRLPVEDETCTGSRELPGATGAEFWKDYSSALLSQKKPCMRMQFAEENHSHSLATVCHSIKFCDYYGFQYKALRDKEENLLKIETDCSTQSEEQMRTRLEAFAELLKPSSAKNNKSSGQRYVCGIDSGSASTKAVILDQNKNLRGFSILATGGSVKQSADKAFKEALDRAGLKAKEIARTITTGYGRNNLNISNSSVTEISCHAKGALYLYPPARTVIDIGGQDSKVIVLDQSGNVINFVMNDKCAAGTGRFLETMAKTLDFSLKEMSDLGLEWKNSVTISSTCTVFAESEVVSLIANNTGISDIINGLNQSVAAKTVSLVKRAKGDAPYIMTGGVASNSGVVKALETALSKRIFVPEEAQICGALGAALFALE